MNRQQRLEAYARRRGKRVNELTASEMAEAAGGTGGGTRARSAPREYAGSGHIEVGADRADRWRTSIERGLAQRMGLTLDPDELRDGIQANHRRLADLATENLLALEIPGARSLSPVQVWQEVLNPANKMRAAANNTGADLPNLLGNAANKAVIRAYQLAKPTWRSWCRVGDIADFKIAPRVQLSDYGQLRETGENGEILDSKVNDRAENISLAAYARRASFTLQMFINDDLRALGSLMAGFGRQAAVLPSRLVYTHLLANPTMSDGVALFHSDHGNLRTGGSSALGTTALATALSDFKRQTVPQAPGDPGLPAEPADIEPGVLIIPPELDFTASQLANPNLYVAENQFFENRFKVESEPRLSHSGYTGYSTTQWFLAAAAEAMDTFEVAFLNGDEEGNFSSWSDFERLAVQFRLWLACGVKALDWRGIHRSDGA